MNRDTSEIVSELKGQRSEILQEWLDRRQVNASREGVTLQSRKAWMDHIPKIFDQVVEALALETANKNGDGKAHGKTRLQQGFDLAEAILDLNLLEEILSDRVGESIGSCEEETFTPVAVHQINRIISLFFNHCVVESAYTYLRREDQMHQRREIQLRRRIDSLGDRLQENLKVVCASAHDLKGSNDVLVRLAEHALNNNGNGSDPKALLQALSRGLIYNQQILDDLSILSINRPPGKPEKVDAEEVIRTIGWRCALAFGDPESRIKWKRTEKLALHLHRLALERIISNLIDNAFSHGGDAPVTLEWYSSEEKENQWVFEIENEVEDDVEAIDSETNVWVEEPRFLEMGLGLSVVSSLLDSLDGKLLFRLDSDRRLRIRATLAIHIETHEEPREERTAETSGSH